MSVIPDFNDKQIQISWQKPYFAEKDLMELQSKHSQRAKINICHGFLLF
jgi:hypothetical protein